MAVPPTLKTTVAHDFSARMFRPTVDLMVRMKVKANTVTVIGLFRAVGSGIAFGAGLWWWSVTLLLLNGFSDMLDGEISRRTPNRPMHLTQLGAFLDPAVDRFADSALFLGAIASCLSNVAHWITLLVVATGLANLISSWLRAKIESLDRKLTESRPITRATFHVQLIATGFFAGIFPSHAVIIFTIGMLFIATTTLWTCALRSVKAVRLFKPTS
jgi:phosphatidylglycerophosphate synthase